jgi:hypothetical protein
VFLLIDFLIPAEAGQAEVVSPFFERVEGRAGRSMWRIVVRCPPLDCF